MSKNDLLGVDVPRFKEPAPPRTTFSEDIELHERLKEALKKAHLFGIDDKPLDDTGVFYRINQMALFRMPIKEVAKATGLSVQILYRVRNGQSALSDNGSRLLCEDLGIDLTTFMIVCRYARVENHRFETRHGGICVIPAALMKYFEPYTRRGGTGPKTERFKAMCRRRKEEMRGKKGVFLNPHKYGYGSLREFRDELIRTGKRPCEIFPQGDFHPSAGLDGGRRKGISSNLEGTNRGRRKRK